MEELKPCPFCGGDAKLSQFVNGIIKKTATSYVKCQNCGARTFVEFDLNEAVNKWNRRAT